MKLNLSFQNQKNQENVELLCKSEALLINLNLYWVKKNKPWIKGFPLFIFYV